MTTTLPLRRARRSRSSTRPLPSALSTSGDALRRRIAIVAASAAFVTAVVAIMATVDVVIWG